MFSGVVINSNIYGELITDFDVLRTVTILYLRWTILIIVVYTSKSYKESMLDDLTSRLRQVNSRNAELLHLVEFIQLDVETSVKGKDIRVEKALAEGKIACFSHTKLTVKVKRGQGAETIGSDARHPTRSLTATPGI